MHEQVVEDFDARWEGRWWPLRRALRGWGRLHINSPPESGGLASRAPAPPSIGLNDECRAGNLARQRAASYQGTSSHPPNHARADEGAHFGALLGHPQ